MKKNLQSNQTKMTLKKASYRLRNQFIFHELLKNLSFNAIKMLYEGSRWPGHLLIIWQNFFKRHNKKIYKCDVIIWSLLELFSRRLNCGILEYTAIIDGIIKLTKTITIDFFRLYEMELNENFSFTNSAISRDKNKYIFNLSKMEYQ